MKKEDEIKEDEIKEDEIKEMVQPVQQLDNDITKLISEMKKEIDELKKENTDMKKQVKEIPVLKKQVKKLQEELNELRGTEKSDIESSIRNPEHDREDAECSAYSLFNLLNDIGFKMPMKDVNEKNSRTLINGLYEVEKLLERI